MREYTRYAIQELVQPMEFEKIISELLFNLGQDAAFPESIRIFVTLVGQKILAMMPSQLLGSQKMSSLRLYLPFLKERIGKRNSMRILINTK